MSIYEDDLFKTRYTIIKNTDLNKLRVKELYEAVVQQSRRAAPADTSAEASHACLHLEVEHPGEIGVEGGVEKPEGRLLENSTDFGAW